MVTIVSLYTGNALPIGGVYTATPPTKTEGQISPLLTDVSGNLLMANSGQLQALSSGVEKDSVGSVPMRRSDSYEAELETADATTAVTVKAAVSSKSIYITDISISTDTAGWVKIQDSAGSPATIIAKKYLPANSVWSKTYVNPKQVVNGNAVKVLAQNAGNVSVDMNGYAI